MFSEKKKNKKIIYFLVSFLFLCFSSPLLAAPPPTTPDTISDIFTVFSVENIVGLFPVFYAVALITFFVGVIKFIRAGDNEEKRSSGRSIMVYGIIVLFIMISAWGMVALLTNSFFGTGPAIPNNLPELKIGI